MDKAQMTNVDAAAVMHNGQWLKISDRDEVNDLQNQNDRLQNRLDENEFINMNVTGSYSGVDTVHVMCHLPKSSNELAQITGVVYSPIEGDLGSLTGDVIATLSLNNVRFTNSTKFVSTHSTINTGQMFRIRAANGNLEIIVAERLSTYMGIYLHKGDPIPVDEYEQFERI